jgi:hypothetical protein
LIDTEYSEHDTANDKADNDAKKCDRQRIDKSEHALDLLGGISLEKLSGAQGRLAELPGVLANLDQSTRFIRDDSDGLECRADRTAFSQSPRRTFQRIPKAP